MIERRPIPGRPGYEVDEEGSVWSTRSRWGATEPRKLKPFPNRDGYLRVTLGGRCISIHALVAGTFIGPRPPGNEVNHRDGDRTNNRPGNLEYTTPSENHFHAVEIGLCPLGEQRRNAKLTVAAVLEARRLRAEGVMFTVLAAKYGVSTTAITNAVKKKTWRRVTRAPSEGKEPTT